MTRAERLQVEAMTGELKAAGFTDYRIISGGKHLVIAANGCRILVSGSPRIDTHAATKDSVRRVRKVISKLQSHA